jgi:hypothetical protein
MDVVQYFTVHHSEFIWQVLVPIFAWLGLLLIFFIILFAKYTFGNWTTENPNPYQDETWGMPRGTFRGSLTLTLLYVVIILEVVNVRIIGFEQEIHEFMVAFQMMIAFYFGAKVMHHITASDKKKAYAYAEAEAQFTQNNNNNQSDFSNSGIQNPPENLSDDDGAVG